MPTEGGRGKKSWKFADVLNAWSLGNSSQIGISWARTRCVSRYFWNYFQVEFYFCIQLSFRTYDKFASMRCNLDSISLNCFCLVAARALAVSLSSISFSFILLTSSSLVFHKSWFYDFFFTKFHVLVYIGLQSVFWCYDE